MPRSRSRLLRLCGALAAPLIFPSILLVALLAGCLTTPSEPLSPPVALPAAFSPSGSGSIAARWWTAFGDTRLEQRMDAALSRNFTIAVAAARLDQARASARATGAPLRPQLDGTAGADEQWSESDSGRTAEAGWRLGLAAAYEVDLWGRLRASQDAAVFSADAAAADLEAAAVTVTAAVAEAWFRLAERHAQLTILARQERTNADALEVVTARFRSSQAGAADVLQQRQLLEASRGERLLIEADIRTIEHQLAVLTGAVPAVAPVDPPPRLPTRPAPLPATGIPADWVTRRPDLRAADHRLRQADRALAAAVAARLPSLRLTADAATTATRPIALFEAWTAEIVAAVAAPLLDGGRRQAEVDRAQAVVRERLAAYGTVLLTALAEVEDALAKEAAQTAWIANLERRLELAATATERILANYTAGDGDFNRYLTSRLSQQRLERELAAAQLQRIRYRIALHRALAGPLFGRAGRTAPPSAASNNADPVELPRGNR